YPWLRRPRGFPAKDRKRDRTGARHGPCRQPRHRKREREREECKVERTTRDSGSSSSNRTATARVPSRTASGDHARDELMIFDACNDVTIKIPSSTL
ncbi:hypothetical protein X777_01243, partial [Ooceraea biroi]